MQKDAIRKEREERKKERLREEQNGEEKHRRRKDEDGMISNEFSNTLCFK